MAAGWNADTAAGPVGSGTVTLVEGSSFCISSANGDIHPEHPHGVFHEDTRILSRWNLSVNGLPLEALTAETKEPYRALFIGRVPRSDGYADSPLIVERLREVGAGIREEITIRNYSAKETECVVSLSVESDFADLFEVKEARVQRRWEESRQPEGDSLVIRAGWQDLVKSVIVNAAGAEVTADSLTYRAVVPPRGVWSSRVSVAPASTAAGCRRRRLSVPARGDISPSDRRRQEWVAKIPKLHMGNRSIERTLRRSYDDLGALRIEDPAHPERIVVAAGAPWFMTLFGRDSLWASEMALPVDPSLALGTLQTLADRQGRVVDPMSEEEPGKILHEVRLGVSSGLALGGKSAYYGSVDATPQFVMALGSVSRWGFARDTIAALLPHADRALDWVRNYGDKDGDGFVEYERLNDQGLINQGWKDSWDGINFADGTLAEPPIALCEVQALVYSAFLSRAWMAYDAGDAPLAARLTEEAAQLKKKFNEQFWLPDRGYYAVALDRDKRPVDACASNMGQCLWHGIVDDDKTAAGGRPADVPRDVQRLGRPDSGHRHGRLQPGQLPQRVRLAPRQRRHCGRTDALRLRGGGAADRHRAAGGRRIHRRAPPGTVLRLQPGPGRGAGAVSDGVLPAGVGGHHADHAGYQPDAVRRARVPGRRVDGPGAAGILRRPAHHQRTHGRRPDHHRHHRFRALRSGAAGWIDLPPRAPAVADGAAS